MTMLICHGSSNMVSLLQCYPGLDFALLAIEEIERGIHLGSCTPSSSKQNEYGLLINSKAGSAYGHQNISTISGGQVVLTQTHMPAVTTLLNNQVLRGPDFEGW